MARSRKHEIGVGAILVVAAVILGWMAVQVGAVRLGDRVEVEARFLDAAGLQVGAAVSVAGVEVGTVDAMQVDHDRAVAAMALDPGAGLTEGTRARVRSRSILGEKYVELLPGPREAPPLEDGDTLPVLGPQWEIDELVSALGPLVASAEGGSLGQVLEALARAVEEDPDRVARILRNADEAMADGAEAAAELPDLARDARATVREARAVSEALARATAEGRAVLSRADGVMDDVEAATEPLPGAAADVSAAAEEARVTAAEARALVEALRTHEGDLEILLDNLSGLDREAIHEILREDGIRIRFSDP